MRRHNRYSIRAALDRSNSFPMRCAEVLYKRQTIDERAIAMSVYVNRLGFNRADAATVTGIVESFRDSGHVSHEDVQIVRERCWKYTRQLSDHANGQHVDLAAYGWEAVAEVPAS